MVLTPDRTPRIRLTSRLTVRVVNSPCRVRSSVPFSPGTRASSNPQYSTK